MQMDYYSFLRPLRGRVALPIVITIRVLSSAFSLATVALGQGSFNLSGAHLNHCNSNNNNNKNSNNNNIIAPASRGRRFAPD